MSSRLRTTPPVTRAGGWRSRVTRGAVRKRRAQGKQLALAAHGDVAHERAHALDEVALVAQGLEPDQVVFQQRVQQLEAPRQLDENIERRKRRVQEKGRFDLA